MRYLYIAFIENLWVPFSLICFYGEWEVFNNAAGHNFQAILMELNMFIVNVIAHVVEFSEFPFEVYFFYRKRLCVILRQKSSISEFRNFAIILWKFIWIYNCILSTRPCIISSSLCDFLPQFIGELGKPVALLKKVMFSNIGGPPLAVLGGVRSWFFHRMHNFWWTFFPELMTIKAP